MKRLRDEEAAPGSIEAAAIDLLGAALPLEISPLARARVRVALTKASAAPTSWMLRPVVVVLFLLAGATVAGASLGVRLLASRRPAVVPLVPPVPLEPPAAPPAPVIVEEPAAAAVDLPSSLAPPRTRPPHHVAARLAPPVAPPEAPAPVTAPADDPTVVATALRALRREHDPTRAGTLVEEYLRRWPSGALTEEAMALAVEAAAARHDARAGAWAERYLRRFPNGRFRDVVARSAPRP